ncbi:MAG: histidinol-phosphatase HisJ family protein [candidate division WOR-3 bacterium]|jgi:histidinol-phosphatase (PHP family)
MIDLHNHSLYSYDSKRLMEDIVVEALSKNIKILGFSDHLDFNQNDPGNMFYKGESQFEEFLSLKSKYQKKIKLFLGIESSYEKDYEEKIVTTFKKFPFDYIIVSLHFVEGIVISDWIVQIEKDKENILDVDYEKYFLQLESIVDFKNFNILGHIDYYKKYSKFSDHKITFRRYEKYYERILKKIIKNNIILEINTSGLRHKCKEQFPSTEILSLYRDFGGKYVSTGSDSHKTGDVAFGFENLEKIIKNFNFEIFKP